MASGDMNSNKDSKVLNVNDVDFEGLKVKHRVGRLSVSEDGEIFAIPPAQKVQFILGGENNDSQSKSHPIFSEMEVLDQNGKEVEWKEAARWIKFEEDVEEGGNRWSKPHVATLSLHSLFELRSLILNGTIILDSDTVSLDQVADVVFDKMIKQNLLSTEQKVQAKEVLLLRHRHLNKKRKDGSTSKLPLIRSLADIGKNFSTSKLESSISNTVEDGGAPLSRSSPERSTDFGRYLSIPGRGSVNSKTMAKSYSNVSINRVQSSGDLMTTSQENAGTKTNNNFMRKIPPDSEASNILVGEVDFLDKTVCAFIRLRHSIIMGDLTEVPVPTRFIFILLGPKNTNVTYNEIGRAMATLMSDDVFHEVAYRAKNRTHLLAGVDEFLDAVTVLPPGEWDPKIRIEPPAALPSQEERKRTSEKLKEDTFQEEIMEQKLREMSGLSRTGVLFGGLKNDFKRKLPWYWSDFKDALAIQCVASWIFLYFACLSPIITFGGLLSQVTAKNMAAMESLISGFVCGVGYGIFSGQPLTILGSTGPVLVFETIVFDFCKSNNWNYMSFRLCIGAWISLILLTLVAFDASAFVCYITRFTEENFATLIAFIFIIKAIENTLSINKKYPINTNSSTITKNCTCILNESFTYNFDDDEFDIKKCQNLNGTLNGIGCNLPKYVPDVFLMSIILFCGTFIISMKLKSFKNSLFFSTNVRQVVSDFAVIIAIFSMSLLDYFMNIPTPKLEVPSEFKPTLETRGWIIAPFNENPSYSAIIAVLPAILGTILIFMDQQITAVIVNRKENKLKKGCGYHLDLFVLGILILICSIMGLPWFVAATVLSINHVNSLKVESECAAPGEKPKFLGVREQRVTHILIFITIGLSVFLTSLLKHIPMPVLYGVFLYMGAASLKGLQFFDRILIIFMPNKYQPDYIFLRQVPINRVHLFTSIQFLCLLCLWLVKSFSSTSIFFPLMLVVMIGVRKSLDFVFTRRELKILDDVMPESKKFSHDDTQKLNISNETVLNTVVDSKTFSNGSLKVPEVTINISEEVNKTNIWKQVNNNNVHKACFMIPKDITNSKKKSKKDPNQNFDNDDDDGGITIKVTDTRF